MITLIVLALLIFALWKFVVPHVHRHGGWFLRVAFVAALILAVVVIVAPYAHAAEKPWTACGGTITWGIQASPGNPETLPAVIGGAYAEIAPLAGWTTILREPDMAGIATVRWAWDDPGAGAVTGDVDTSDINGMTNITARVHGHSRTGPSAGPALKSLVLKDIGRDMGLTLQAVTGHLTKADRVAVKAVCAAQKASSTPSASSTAPGAPAATAAPGGTAVDTPATPATDTTDTTAGQRAIGYTGALLGVLALALVLAGGPVLRKLAGKAGVKRPRWLRRPHWLHLPQRGTPKLEGK